MSLPRSVRVAAPLVVILLSSAAHADGPAVRFGAQKAIPWRAYGPPGVVEAVDFDRDGDLDLLMKAGDEGSLSWIENKAGRYVERLIDPDCGPRASTAGDVDSDGDLDVVSIHEGGISWFENVYLGRAFERRAIAVSTDCQEIAVGDVDGDGKADVVCSRKGVRWYRNLGGKFAAAEEHLPMLDGYRPTVLALLVTDVDRDKDADVFAVEDGGSSSTPNRLVLLRSGKGAPERTVVASDAYTLLATADVNGDGFPDVLASTGRKSVLFTSAGGKSFSQAELAPGSSEDGDGFVCSLDDGDFDGDGDVDLMMGRSGRATLLVNGGGAWKEQPMFEYPGAAGCRLFAGDADQDGDPDVVGNVGAPGIHGTRLVAVETRSKKPPGKPMAGPPPASPVTFGAATDLPANTSHGGDMSGLDFDRDGDADLLLSVRVSTAGESRFSLIESTGGGKFVARSIDGEFLATGAVAADLDGDGDTDVAALGAPQNGDVALAWFENKKKGKFVRRTLLEDAAKIRALQLGDVDGDGKADVVCVRAGEGVEYHRSLGGGQFAEAESIFPSTRTLSGLVVADFDGDKDADALVREGDYGQEFLYLRNDEGAFAKRLYLHMAQNGVAQGVMTVPADMNKDGLLDILVSQGSYLDLYQNVAGKAFGRDEIIPWSSLADIDSIDAGDLDGDGDMDVLLGRDKKVTWLENQAGVFARDRTIFEHREVDSQMRAGDVDKDGDADVLGYLHNVGYVWIENKAPKAGKGKKGR